MKETAHVLDAKFTPEPQCVCGGLWIDNQCAIRSTFLGASFEFSEAIRALGRAIVSAVRGST